SWASSSRSRHSAFPDVLHADVTRRPPETASRKRPPREDRPMAANQEPFGDRFNRVAARLTEALGSVTALVLSVVVVLVWAVTGPIFHFSDTWQLVINTATTVVTFWMVFVIQNSANRDQKAVQLKLDEIIR